MLRRSQRLYQRSFSASKSASLRSFAVETNSTNITDNAIGVTVNDNEANTRFFSRSRSASLSISPDRIRGKRTHHVDDDLSSGSTNVTSSIVGATLVVVNDTNTLSSNTHLNDNARLRGNDDGLAGFRNKNSTFNNTSFNSTEDLTLAFGIPAVIADTVTNTTDSIATQDNSHGRFATGDKTDRPRTSRHH